MNIQDIFDNAQLQYLTGTEITTSVISIFMSFSFAFAFYIFIIYRMTTNTSFYSPIFAKTLVGMPIITTAIILAMQGSLIISLGMVGALSIVRFRTAIKSPIDLLFLFWGVSIGIICGTGLFELAFSVCLIMTIVCIGLDYIPMGNVSYILTITADDTFNENFFIKSIGNLSKNIKVRTRIVANNEQELLIELHTKRCEELVKFSRNVQGVLTVSLIYHDGEVRF